MAVDTFAKRMTVAGVPFLPLGVNVFPGTTNVILGRAAAAWNYAPVAPAIALLFRRTLQLRIGGRTAPYHL